MAEANWSLMTGGLSTGVVRRGVTAGTTPPNGGGTYTFGFNSVAATAGSVALYTAQANFIPAASGGSITAALRRGPSASPTAYSSWLFIGAQGTALSDNAYMLGFSDNNPSTITLRKGALSEGIVDGEEGDEGILRRGTTSYDEGVWVHLRLDMIVNPSGDTILAVWENDLDSDDVTTPTWTAVAGMDDFIDDTLGVNSGSAPFASGYMGYGFQVEGLSRRAYFDHITCARQV